MWTQLIKQSETRGNLTRGRRSSNRPTRITPVESSHMLESLLSLLGEGFDGSFAALPLEEAAASAPEAAGAAAAAARLVCSSP